MSKMKSMALLAGLMLASTPHGGQIRDEYIPIETEEEKRKRLKALEEKHGKANGLTEFFYGNNSLWALNEKSADKKAKKRNWI